MPAETSVQKKKFQIQVYSDSKTFENRGGVMVHGHPGWHRGLLSAWLPVLHSRSLVLVSGIYKGSAALALRFPLLHNVLFFRLQ